MGTVNVEISFDTYVMIKLLREFSLDEFKKELTEDEFKKLSKIYDFDFIIQKSVKTILDSAKKHANGGCQHANRDVRGTH